MSKTQLSSTKQIALMATIFAIMITFLICLPIIAHVPLIALTVIALSMNVRMAALGGLLFGLASLLSALLVPSTPLYVVFLNPLISVAPRVLVGIVIHLVYKGIFRMIVKYRSIGDIQHPQDILSLDVGDRLRVKKIDYISMTIASVAGAVTNTVLVVGLILLIYSGRTFILEDNQILVAPQVLFPLISIGAITEPIAAAIAAPPIVAALRHLN